MLAPAVAVSTSAGRGSLLLWSGLLLFAAIALAAAAASLLAPVGPYVRDLAAVLAPPAWMGGSAAHPLGTDALGRDVLSRLLLGARVSLAVGGLATLLAAAVGIILGLLGGYARGTLDRVVVFLISIRLSLPVVIVALVLVSRIGASVPLDALVLGMLLWTRFAVVARGTTQRLRTLPFVRAAQASGSGPLRIIRHEILPHISGALLVTVPQEFAVAVVLEATLAYLGFAVQPPLPSWGLMLAEATGTHPPAAWLLIPPGAALFLLMLSLYLIGEGLHRRMGGAAA